MGRSPIRSRAEHDIARVTGSRRALTILGREAGGGPGDAEIVWLASPFPYERKPVVPTGVVRDTTRVGWADLETLIGTQRRVTRHGVERHAASPWAPGDDPDRLPLVYHADSGKSYVADGHHRLAAAYLWGDRRARARIAEIGALDR